ncbi:FecR family protein [Chitinophaga sp. Ak27]|uniref:FecR family protein n=1 Tax=Chitinophaga sp. Ak27 TaxID=2726116 RepID=UPI00145DE2BC|nr:FecR family protein [Chitinophaga sp. Ak27]NLU91422.1 DUF4974 domain-containing protein [Chitinophaga sp. Ak27]
MHPDKDAIQQLARKYMDGVASDEEIRLLHDWYDDVNPGEMEAVFTDSSEMQFGTDTWQRIQQQMNAEKLSRAKIRPLHRWWAAAAVLVLAGGLWAIQVHNNRHKSATMVASKPLHDIKAPAANHAVLTLAGGRQILLDSAGNGLVASQTGMNIMKNDSGSIVYVGDGSQHDIQYNTLTIPAGSKPLSIALSDGSRVWLNAASSLTFPTAFSGKERKVLINGEGYFEVATNSQAPFVVARPDKGLQVQVLGTAFNVNAYDGEPDIRVTLISGAVKISRGASQPAVTMAPGQQVRISPTNMEVLKDVDMDVVMAWKDGLFVFDGTDIQVMMRQAARWYNITVKYPHGVPAEHFTGSLSRDASLLEFLKILDYSGVIANIDGKTVFINP